MAEVPVQLAVRKRPTQGAVVLIVIALLFSLGANVAYTSYSIRTSNQNWCSTLKLLTANKASYAKSGSLALYGDFVNLERRYKC